MTGYLSWLGERASGGAVDVRRNSKQSLTSKLGRAKGVDLYAAAPDPGADFGTQVGALADLVAWALHDGCDGALLELAISPHPRQAAVLSTLAAVAESLDPRWPLRLVEIDADGTEVRENPSAPDVGTHPNAVRWAGYMEDWQRHQPEGLAAALVERLDDRRIILHPQLSKRPARRAEWQLRVEGLQVGTVTADSAVLWVGKDGKQGGQSSARSAWIASGGRVDKQAFGEHEADLSVRQIRAFVDELATRTPLLGDLLNHGQPEHALESGILRKRVRVESPSGRSLTVPYDDPQVTWAGQIPTVWSEHSPRARYNDVLLADEETPWVVELKVPGQAGGWGAYLRKGIHQCVLYRRFLRQATPYQGWMAREGLDHTLTRAALTYPDTDRSAHAAGLEILERTAAAFDVPVLELDVRPSTGAG